MAFGISRGVRFNILSDSDIDRIHWGTLHILEKFGVQVDSIACRKILKDNGCEVDEKTRIAKIPSHLVEEALAKKKTSITLAARNPKYDLKLDIDDLRRDFEFYRQRQDEKYNNPGSRCP